MFFYDQQLKSISFYPKIIENYNKLIKIIFLGSENILSLAYVHFLLYLCKLFHNLQIWTQILVMYAWQQPFRKCEWQIALLMPAKSKNKYPKPYNKACKWYASLSLVSLDTLVPTCSLPNNFNKMRSAHSSRYAPIHATYQSSYS